MGGVGAVPEHVSGLGSPRAREWSGQSPSIVVVWAVHDHERRLYYYLVYLFVSLLYQVQSDTSGQKNRQV